MEIRESAVDMDFRRQNDGSCTPCPFSEPGKGDTSNPVFQNPPSGSDADCFSKNAAALLSSLDIANPGAPGEVTAQGCNALADVANGDNAFYVLYYLDKTYCGLGQAHHIGDDPNVNSILTNCSHYGISDLADPGWPSSSYQCSVCKSTTEKSVQTASATISTSTTPPTTTAETTSKASSSGFSTTASSSFITIPTSTSDDSSSSVSVSHRLPAQGIAAIVVCTTLAIAAALLLLFCVLRRRRKRIEAYSGGMSRRISRTANAYIPPGRDNYEPLISPSHSFSGERPELTPPPRLSDRRILPSLLRPLSRSQDLVFSPPVKTGDHSSSGLYSTIQNSGDAKYDILASQEPTTQAVAGKPFAPFSSSPFGAPTSNKLNPRLEKMQTYAQPPVSPDPPSSPQYTQLKSPPPVSFTFPPRTSLDTTSRSSPPAVPAARKGHHRRGTAVHPFSSSTSTSVSSGGGGGGGGGGGPNDHGAAIISTAPGTGSPTRPRRPHEAPLEIPGLVTPLSASTFPATNKSLPQPLPQPPPTTIGLAKTTGSPQLPREESISLHSLAEQHKRDRDSWGTWGDEEEEEEEEGMGTATAAGRIFGVAFPPANGPKGGG